jgi:hypothetical protein
MTAVAGCHSNERKFNKTSDVRAIAQTRATNRAVADIIGWSAPSAEEMMSEELPGEVKGEPDADRQWLNDVLQKHEERTSEGFTPISQTITDKQRALLVSLINQKVYDPQEREAKLDEIDGLTKQDAHELISELLSNRN